jgi:hypothetical protein
MITQVELGSGPRAGTAELAAHSEKVPAELVVAGQFHPDLPPGSLRVLAVVRREFGREFGVREQFSKKSQAA